jgi:hypothetical protein
MRLQLHAEDPAGLVKKREQNQLPTITNWHWLLNNQSASSRHLLTVMSQGVREVS